MCAVREDRKQMAHYRQVIKRKIKGLFIKMWAGLVETNKGGGSHSGKPLVPLDLKR